MLYMPDFYKYMPEDKTSWKLWIDEDKDPCDTDEFNKFMEDDLKDKPYLKKFCMTYKHRDIPIEFVYFVN